MDREAMPTSGDGDDLIARLAAIEPARAMPALPRSSIHTLTRSTIASHRAARPWTWARLELASAGALLCSGALVVAGILGMDAAGTPATLASSVQLTRVHPLLGDQAPTAPAAFDARSGAPSVVPEALSNAVYCPVALQLGTQKRATQHAPDHVGAIQIASVLSPRRALSALAPRFGLSTAELKWYPTAAHAKAWWVGSLRGPSLTTFSLAGITWWSFAGRRESSAQLRRETGRRGRDLKSAVSSRLDALALLARLGITGHLGVPHATRSATAVRVSVPIVEHGLESDEGFDVTYGPLGQLQAAAGPLVVLGREVAYPVISPLRATQLLRRPVGALLGITAPTTPATMHRHQARRSGAAAVCAALAGPRSVSSASMTLRTKELSDGRVWLLPSWTFSARPGAAFGHAQSGTTSLVAINPKFLVYGPAEVHYRHHAR